MRAVINGCFLIVLTIFCVINTTQGQHTSDFRNYQQNQILTPFRIALPTSITYKDLDSDGDPDLLMGTLPDSKKVIWIDDDDDMKIGDQEGDLDSDCVMIDLNGDGKYGSEKDLIVDWNDINGDGKADIQMIVDNGFKNSSDKWLSHFIIFFDDDKDGVFSYVNWDEYKFEGWDLQGKSNFFADYNGQSKMLKVHITTWNLVNLEYNWENPFLYYDHDNDGYTEMAIRIVDEPIAITPNDKDDLQVWEFSNKISKVAMTWDMDNDSGPSSEQDFDMSIQFKGSGYDYSDQVHQYKNLGGLADADYLFDDPRWRHMDRLVFPDHDVAIDLTYDRGDWNETRFVFDEDDDCHRWERVEFYDPLDPFKIGVKNGGIDNHPQADAAGDRGEWDEDNSGQGQIYVSPLDCRIHLYGAELGYWRIDQNATYYQGWQGWRGPNLQPEDFVRTEPTTFGTVKYEDTDANGFMDLVSFDMDGDFKYEEIVSLIELGIEDKTPLYNPADLSYHEISDIYKMMANEMWNNALDGVNVAKQMGLNTEWYALMMKPNTLRDKYNYGYWLSYYIYRDIKILAGKKRDNKKLREIKKAYFSTNWKSMIGNK